MVLIGKTAIVKAFELKILANVDYGRETLQVHSLCGRGDLAPTENLS